MKVYTLPEPRPIERALLKKLGGTSRLADWKEFPNGELFVRVRDVERRVVVIGRFGPPAENLARTLLLCDTLRRSGAKRIDLVLPYMAYARQDRQRVDGDPVSADWVLRMTASLGVDRIVTTDIHSERVLEFTPMPITSISMVPEMAEQLRPFLGDEPFTVVAPDRGAMGRADAFAARIGGRIGRLWIEKYRDENGRLTIRKAFGHPLGKTAVVVDDQLDTGGTVDQTVRLLKDQGFDRLVLCIVHPVFSNDAAKIVRRIGFKRVLITDTMPFPAGLRGRKEVRVISAADALAAAVKS